MFPETIGFFNSGTLNYLDKLTSNLPQFDLVSSMRLNASHICRVKMLNSELNPKRLVHLQVDNKAHSKKKMKT